MTRTDSRAGIRGAGALAALLALASSAAAAERPDAVRLAALAATLDTARFVRVVTSHAAFETRSARADSAGVHVVKGKGRAGLVTIGEAPREERLLPWSDVLRIEVARPASGALLAGGLGVGVLLAGVSLGIAVNSDSDVAGPALYYGAAAGAAAALIGLLTSSGHSEPRTVFP